MPANAEPPLDEVPEKTYERAWKMFTEFGASERHFNQMQSQYRTLASTWLLATFGAVGFILSETITLPFDRLLLVAAIGLAGSIGITLLWNLDLLVYHRLLDAYFTEGLRLEARYPWLPPVRTRMMSAARTVRGSEGVLPRVVWYYIAGNSMGLIIAGTALTFWLQRYSNGAALLGALFSLAVIVLWARYMRRATGVTGDAAESHADARP